MIEIKIEDNGECKIAISGNERLCAFEMSLIAQKLFKENKFIADSFVFGLANRRSKEEMLEVVDMAYKSIEMENMSKDIKSKNKNKDVLKEIDSLLDDILKDLLGGKKE